MTSPAPLDHDSSLTSTAMIVMTVAILIFTSTVIETVNRIIMTPFDRSTPAWTIKSTSICIAPFAWRYPRDVAYTLGKSSRLV